MAIAYPTPAPFKQPSNLFRKSGYALLKPLYYLRAIILRFFWHTKAYSTIMGIMVLALVSIGFLWLYETGRKLLRSRSGNTPCTELNSLNNDDCLS